MDNYALGYEKTKNISHLSHKVLRFVDHCYAYSEEERVCEFELYSFKSNSWKVVDWVIEVYDCGLSLKGNTYWYAKEKRLQGQLGDANNFLICFDFTTERFGPRLPLPFHSPCSQNTVSLSSVGEEQLAVLFHDSYTLGKEIWVTNKIEPKEVPWNKLFLAVNVTPVSGYQFLY